MLFLLDNGFKDPERNPLYISKTFVSVRVTTQFSVPNEPTRMQDMSHYRQSPSSARFNYDRLFFRPYGH